MLNLSEAELLKIYNHVPKALSRKVIKVSVIAAESLRNKQHILLEEAKNGSYWIITPEERTDWLFPKGNLSINPQYETVKSLFDCHGYQPENAREFTLKKPARVSLVPNGKKWQLEEKGILKFGKASPLAQLETELEQAHKERVQLQEQLAQFKQGYQQLQSRLTQSEQKCQQLLSMTYQLTEQLQEAIQALREERKDSRSLLQESINLLREEIKEQREEHKDFLSLLKSGINQPKRSQFQESERQVSQDKINLPPAIPSSPLNSSTQEDKTTVEPTEQGGMRSGEGEQREQQVTAQSPQVFTDVNLNNAEFSLVEAYKTSQSLSTHKVEVSETRDSIESRRSGNTESAVFGVVESSGSGTYRIIKEKDGQFYLVPKDKRTINKEKLAAFQASFKCRNYQEGKANKFKLVKPAKLYPISEKQWKLEEKGVLEFFQSQSSEVEAYKTSQILSTHKVEVSETKDSIESRRFGKREPAVFEEVKRAGSGTYLVIKGQDGQLYLVPKDKLTIHKEKFAAFQASFECRNYQEGKANKLKLVKPAKLSPISEKQWKLEEKGVLEFFQSQSSEVEAYKTSQILSTHKVEVSETRDSIKSSRVGKREPAVFEEVKRGTYFVIKGQDGQLYLVPKDKLTINKEKFEVIQDSFECFYYEEGKANKLKLVKPAKLSPISEKQWKLEEKGVVEFFQSQSSE
ncbi:MAG: hypothetical protein AB4426_31330 [Xenococcaceae cyanobacterium]